MKKIMLSLMLMLGLITSVSATSMFAENTRGYTIYTSLDKTNVNGDNVNRVNVQFYNEGMKMNEFKYIENTQKLSKSTFNKPVRSHCTPKPYRVCNQGLNSVTSCENKLVLTKEYY